MIRLVQGTEKIYVKDQRENTLGSVGHINSAATSQPRPYSRKAVKAISKQMGIGKTLFMAQNVDFMQFSCVTKYYSSFNFSLPSEKVKTILSSQII